MRPCEICGTPTSMTLNGKPYCGLCYAFNGGDAGAGVENATLELLDVLRATTDRLFVAYPDTDKDERCPWCGSDATQISGPGFVRVRLSMVGHETTCRWLEAREQVALARRVIARFERVTA